MTSRASVLVITSRVAKMLRLVMFSCCVVLCVGYPNCGKNEEMQCVQACPPEKTCRNRDIRFNCAQVVEPCHHICACKPGFLRNALGQCITNEECDMCQGEHEFFECGSACDNECATLDSQNRTNCPIVNIVCNRKCYCEDGFARDNENKCIPIEKCHSENVEGSSSKIAEDGSRARRHSNIAESICTGENEVYTDCMKSCPPNTCLSIVASFKCDSTEPCKKGCLCKPGYLRQHPHSPCILICQCNEMKNAPECKGL